MKIRYKGGRSRMDISYNRKPYYFTPENNRILDIKEQSVINYIFSLPNSAEFEAVIEDIHSVSVHHHTGTGNSAGDNITANLKLKNIKKTGQHKKRGK